MKSNTIAARALLAAFGLAALAAPLAASAQGAPSYAKPDGPPPTYARPDNGQNIRGTIIGFQGKYGVTMRDERGYVDNIMLHQGTVILPTGLALQPGMQVEIYGVPDGRVFAAGEVDLRQPYGGFIPVPIGPAYDVGIGIGFGHHWR
jgi:invasion protein IalB